MQTRQEPPVEVYVLREIANILYQAPSVDAADLSLVSELVFADDPASALKVRFARPPRLERLSVLVQELAHDKGSYQGDRYEMQLAADEGPAAARAIAAQLEEISDHRGPYTSNDFTMLLRTLAAVGDKDQARLIERFLHEPDGFMLYTPGY